MAIYSFSIKPLAATKVGPAIAYMTRQPVRVNDDTCLPSKTGGLVAEGISLPHGASGELVIGGREGLWSAAVDAERVRKRGPRQGELRRRAVAGRTVIAALPHELSDAQRVALVRTFGETMADRYRCAVDFAIHVPDRSGDQRNHHVHMAFTEREICGDGMGPKIRSFSGRTRGEELRRMRQAWEVACNRALEEAGRIERIDSRSLAAQGHRRPPSRHIGPAGTALIRQGRPSRAGEAAAVRLKEQKEAAQAAAVALARQVRLAREADNEAEAIATWRRLIAECRDAIRAGLATGDALDLAKGAQATEAQAAGIDSQQQQPATKSGRRWQTVADRAPATLRRGTAKAVRTLDDLTDVEGGGRDEEPTLPEVLSAVAAGWAAGRRHQRDRQR